MGHESPEAGEKTPRRIRREHDMAVEETPEGRRGQIRRAYLHLPGKEATELRHELRRAIGEGREITVAGRVAPGPLRETAQGRVVLVGPESPYKTPKKFDQGAIGKP